MADDALPHTTDDRDGYLHGGPKYCQVGIDAAQHLIQRVLDGSNLSDTLGLLMVDCYVKYGDFLLAFILQRAAFNVSTFYFGVCENQSELDWAWNIARDVLSLRYQDGTMELPGGMKLNVMPEDLLDPIPMLPQFHRLVMSGPDNDKLSMPVKLAKQWQGHPTFGSRWTEFLDEFAAQGHIVIEEQQALPSPARNNGGTPGASPNAKRGVGDLDSTPNKKAKIDNAMIMDASVVEQPVLQECKLPGKDPRMFAQIRACHCVVLVNKSTQELSLPANELVLGFGKGAFKLLPGQQESLPVQCEFHLNSYEDLVVFNNSVITVGKLVEQQHESKPDAKICYHKFVDNTEDPKKFKLAQTHKIVFTPKDDSADILASNIGSKESFGVWKTSEVGHLLWSVRWTQKGLMPVKPGFYLKGALILPPGKCCLLCGSVGPQKSDTA